MTHRDYMLQAVGLSSGSFDPTSNKKVGCLIVNNGEIVGTGTRQVYIMKIKPYKDYCIHAEHMAIIEAGIMTRRSTLYCTMEPCTYRHTSDINAIEPARSCCDLIIEAEVKTVFFLADDNYIGQGGKQYLEKHGIEVIKMKI